jgi:hypothetical protein
MSVDPKLRALPPHQLSINLPVRVAGSPHTFLLVDLSTLGMKLSGPVVLQVGESHDFVIDLGVVPSISPSRLTLCGEVRWHSPDDAPDRTLIGVRFASLDPETHVAVANIIDRLAL